MKRKLGWFLTAVLGLGLAIALSTQFPRVEAENKDVAIEPVTELEFLGQANFATGLEFQDTEVGGLSGITYNPDLNVYYTISDDRGEKTPPRFYTLAINVNADTFDENNVEIQAVTPLQDSNGEPLAPFVADPEGITFTGGELYISSEGDVARSIPPFIKQFSLEGQELQDLPIPEKFLTPADNENFGTRNNLALESLTLSPDQQYLFTATEGALIQDGAEADTEAGSPCRIIRYDLAAGEADREFLYLSEPIVINPVVLDENFKVSGLVELLALGETDLLSLERSFSVSAGNVIKIFNVSLKDADPIQGIDQLEGKTERFTPARKTLLLNLNSLGFPLDNVEGITFGPDLPDGRRSLVLVSDNNFNAIQMTQILLFAAS
ncbi:MAG: esterase-like activity of phytase family protein [Microcoleaceae cyanobacterium]